MNVANSYKEFATLGAAKSQARAIDKALGLPAKGVNVGNPPHADVPDSYTAGALGWTATQCAELQDPLSESVLLVLGEEAALLGKRDVTTDDGKVVSLDLTDALLALPEKYETEGP